MYAEPRVCYHFSLGFISTYDIADSYKDSHAALHFNEYQRFSRRSPTARERGALMQEASLSPKALG